MPWRRIQPLFVAAVIAGATGLGVPPAGTARADAGSPDELAALIAALGDDDYHRRESAAAALRALGPTALDALLAAAETSGDLEVSLRAQWLVEAIPFEMPHDPPEVVKLLARFKRRGFADRVQAMHRLLRVDDDGGIEALARVVRLDPSTAGSRVAAALLAREWRPDDPDWPEIRRRIEAGLGPSQRPAARFLTALVGFTGSDLADRRAACLAAADAALADLRLVAADAPARDAAGPAGDERVAVDQVRQILERCHVRMLLAAGRRPAAVEAARAIVAEALGEGDDEGHVVEALTWAVEAGLPEVFETVLVRPEQDRGPLLTLAIANAERALGREPAATARFTATLAAGEEASFADRLQAAMLLAKWGCTDWAVLAYDAILANTDLPAAEAALATVMYSEFLHDLDRDAEAARRLERLFAEAAAEAGQPARGPLLEAVGRDPRATRSRMHFFESCAHRQRNDLVASRAALERALAAYPKDVDALIGIYQLPDNTAEQRRDAVQRIKAALSQLEDEIQAVPDDANGYNEYAWLVANTEGDLDKATRYSRLSLVKSFDNPSYLDTLAHCHAAAGRRQAAIRTQRLAQRQEPHNRTIRRNLERFEAAP